MIKQYPQKKPSQETRNRAGNSNCKHRTDMIPFNIKPGIKGRRILSTFIPEIHHRLFRVGVIRKANKRRPRRCRRMMSDIYILLRVIRHG